MSKQITKLLHSLSLSNPLDANQLIRRIKLDQQEGWNDSIVTTSRALLKTLLLKERLQLYRLSHILAAIDNRVLLITLGRCQLNHRLDYELACSLIISNNISASSVSL